MNRIVFLAVFLTSVTHLCLFAQRDAVSRPLSFRMPYEDYLHNYIESRADAWVKWDRYEESTDQYRERVSEENRKKKYAEWRAEGDSIYKQTFMSTVHWNQFRLIGNYDPENETALVGSELFGDFAVYVPRGESAREFVAQFGQLQVVEPDFVFPEGNTVILNGITFVQPSTGKRFTYDRRTERPYRNVDVAALPRVATDEQPVHPSPAAIVDDRLNVDLDIPQINRVNDDVYGVIIGNEHYFYELDTRFSNNDATVFHEYCVRTLGIPPSNLQLRMDATYGNMLNAIQFLKNAAASRNGNIRVIFYFSGHGMSDLQTNDMFLLPVDCSSRTLEAALKAETLYKELSDMKVISSTVFLDACFSGKTIDGFLAQLDDGRGIEVTPRESSLYGNLIVFSATTDTEIAYPYEDKQHGMFTYFLLKNLQTNKGDVTYRDLADYIIANVKSRSFDINQKLQTPKVRGSFDITTVWQGWKLIK